MSVSPESERYFRLGEEIDLGSHTFSADEIMAFARKYDPQPFHVDEALARESVFGRLCASGWHTVSMWMRHNLAWRQNESPQWSGPGPRPEFGPSPGFTDLRWLRPVFAGETVRFHTRTTGFKPHKRDGWHLLEAESGGRLETGEPVLSFASTVLVKAG